jgi:hypothetical protein
VPWISLCWNLFKLKANNSGKNSLNLEIHYSQFEAVDNCKPKFRLPTRLLWDAITDIDMMKEWYFSNPDLKLAVGAKFNFQVQVLN